MTSIPLASLRRLTAVVAGAGLAFALSSCGSDTADIADDETSAPTETTTSETTSPPEPTDATETTETTDAPTGDMIDGEGYTYAIPEGWEDVSDEPESAQTDSAVRTTDFDGDFAANINVIVGNSQCMVGSDDIETGRECFQQEIQGYVDGEVQALENISIDGEPAIGQTASGELQGQQLVFTQYFAQREASTVVITLTSPEGDTASAEAALDSMLASWAWD